METIEIYVGRSIGYVSRLEVACARRVGTSRHQRRVEEKACGVGKKEKTKDNGYTEIQEICINSLFCQ